MLVAKIEACKMIIKHDLTNKQTMKKRNSKTKTIKKTKTQVLTQIKHKCICGKYYIDKNMK